MKKIFFLRTLTIVVLVTLFAESCDNSKVKSNEKAAKELKSETSELKDYCFIESYSFKNLPLIDTTNFDNFKISDTLTKAQVKSLKLEKIIPEENVVFGINYKLNLSTNFITLVISCYPSLNELTTYLVNYDKDFNIIDFKTIAYDEIAESWLRTTSKIENMRIEITEHNSSSGQEITKTTLFEINENGEIKASH